MTDLDSPEERAALGANELRLWVTLAETGIWCQACALPSAIRYFIQHDPADPPTGSGVVRCLECHPVDAEENRP